MSLSIPTQLQKRNTTTINLTKYKETATKLKLTYNSITRNGVTISVPTTTSSMIGPSFVQVYDSTVVYNALCN